jgi:hypothetical protein
MTRDEAFDRMRDLLRELLDDAQKLSTPPAAEQRKIEQSESATRSKLLMKPRKRFAPSHSGRVRAAASSFTPRPLPTRRLPAPFHTHGKVV